MRVSKVASERMYRWSLAPLEYNMNFFHAHGSRHVDADACLALAILRNITKLSLVLY